MEELPRNKLGGEDAMGASPAPSATRRSWVGRHRRGIFASIAGVCALVLVVMCAYGIYLYQDVSGIRRSNALAGVVGKSAAGTNLLIMGLDSRLDENGHALPTNVYSALHTGDQADGGLNSNVLMLVHIPASGSPVTAISIPRDDYAKFPDCPDKECSGKIKEAYGLATDQEQQKLASQGVTGEEAYQRARDAGRREEIRTVDGFLGVNVNRFIEVTMVAFYKFAKVVEPIPVCVKENTVDTFSGAKFHQGKQGISASEAMAFVRQRRDTDNPGLEFTDLDRERRQQAFVISVLTKLKSAGTLLNPLKVTGLINVAKSNTVLSRGLDPLDLAQLGETLAGGGLHFYTLPIRSFGVVNGQDVNFVDDAAIHDTVKRLLNPPPKAAAHPSNAPTTPSTSPSQEAVSGTGGGSVGPSVTSLTVISSGSVPCVK